jgi:hypothetical protein
MPGLSEAPSVAPPSIRDGLVLAAAAWFDDPARPRLAERTLDQWDNLLAEWISDPRLPRIVRRARNNRGHLLEHRSGRGIVPADNSPAHWSITLAFAECCPSLQEVRDMLASDKLPMAMVFKAEEKVGARFRCTRQAVRGPNSLGWKVAHIDDVGLGYTGDVLNTPVDALHVHMRRFLSPRNMFLVPKEYAGVAETPEFREAFGNRL